MLFPLHFSVTFFFNTHFADVGQASGDGSNEFFRNYDDLLSPSRWRVNPWKKKKKKCRNKVSLWSLMWCDEWTIKMSNGEHFKVGSSRNSSLSHKRNIKFVLSSCLRRRNKRSLNLREVGRCAPLSLSENWVSGCSVCRVISQHTHRCRRRGQRTGGKKFT